MCHSYSLPLSRRRRCHGAHLSCSLGSGRSDLTQCAYKVNSERAIVLCSRSVGSQNTVSARLRRAATVSGTARTGKKTLNRVLRFQNTHGFARKTNHRKAVRDVSGWDAPEHGDFLRQTGESEVPPVPRVCLSLRTDPSTGAVPKRGPGRRQPHAAILAR